MRFTIHRYESVSSTNDVAAGQPEGTVIIAGEQTAGKGRRGRKWSSPPGEGLYLSIVLHPSLPYNKLWQMAFVVSLAACEAIREVSGLDARIKLPNDILINGRKVCGILIETRGRPTVVGIGINVNNQDFPADLNATSLALELGRTISMADMENALLSCLDARYEQFLTDGFQPILELWKALDCTIGRQPTVHTFEGTGLEVAENGDLQIQSGRDASVAE
jgi:BirA family biotin operon repressor/biotin-[acetyl-CoA-carboxylase] ligase